MGLLHKCLFAATVAASAKASTPSSTPYAGSSSSRSLISPQMRKRESALADGVTTSEGTWNEFLKHVDHMHATDQKEAANLSLQYLQWDKLKPSLAHAGQHRIVPDDAKLLFNHFRTTYANSRTQIDVSVFCEFVQMDHLIAAAKNAGSPDKVPLGASYARHQIAKDVQTKLEPVEESAFLLKNVKYDGVIQDFWTMSNSGDKDALELVRYCVTEGLKRQMFVVDVKAKPSSWATGRAWMPRSMTSLYYLTDEEKEAKPVRNLIHRLSGKETDKSAGLFEGIGDTKVGKKTVDNTKVSIEAFNTILSNHPNFFVVIRSMIEDRSFWQKHVGTNMLGLSWLASKTLPIMIALMASVFSYICLPHIAASGLAPLVAKLFYSFGKAMPSLSHAPFGWHVITINTSYLARNLASREFGMFLFTEELRYRITHMLKSEVSAVGATAFAFWLFSGPMTWLKRRTTDATNKIKWSEEKKEENDLGKKALKSLEGLAQSVITLKSDDEIEVLSDFTDVCPTVWGRSVAPFAQHTFPTRVTGFMSKSSEVVGGFFGCGRRANNCARRAWHGATSLDFRSQTIMKGWVGHVYSAPNDVIVADSKTDAVSLREDLPNPYYVIFFTEKDSNAVVGSTEISDSDLHQLFREGKIQKGVTKFQPTDFLSNDVDMDGDVTMQG